MGREHKDLASGHTACYRFYLPNLVCARHLRQL
jgi:hypothetical protein